MIRKIMKEIQKQEKEKSQKFDQKQRLELEINEHSNQLKKLYSLKNDFEKFENGANDYFNPAIDDTQI